MAALKTLGSITVSLVNWIPIPRVVRASLQRIDRRLGGLHRLAPLAGAALVAFGVAQAVLWILHLPLGPFWRFFGWLGSNNPDRLRFYSYFAHVAALLLAIRVALAMRGDDE